MRLAPFLFLCVLLCMILAMCRPCAADDASLNGESGAPMLMKSHPSIRMVSELVKIKLPEGSVDATFVFRNDGPATTATIGFPETGEPEGNGDVPFTTIEHFQSWVDGARVRVRRVGAKHVEIGEWFNAWWLKRVHFNAGQTRIVRDTYLGGLYSVDGEGTNGFYYVLTTGASWHGTIGDAKIVCDISGLRNNGPVYFQPVNGVRDGDFIQWDLRNFKPRQDITVAWFNEFADVSVNGKPVWPRLVPGLTSDEPNFPYDKGELDVNQVGWDADSWGFIRAKRRGDDIWLSAKTASIWLGAHETVLKPGRSIAFVRGDRNAVVTVGSAQISSGAAGVAMPQPAQFIRANEDKDIYAAPPETGGYTMLYLRPLVTALGGTSRWDRMNNRLIVTLPEAGQPVRSAKE